MFLLISVRFKRPKLAPIILALTVLALICGIRLQNPDFIERLERITYDWRVRVAQKFLPVPATNFAFVAMEDSSIFAIQHKLLGAPYGPYGLYWPRHIYGRVVEELSAQGAKAIAFDVLFREIRTDHAPVLMPDGSLMESDDFFAQQIRQASNVISAFTPSALPADLFATNSMALGDISTSIDPDGVLRHLKSFNLNWHPAFKSAAKEYGVDLTQAQIKPDQIILSQPGGEKMVVPLDKDGNFDLVDFVGDNLPKGWKRYAKPYERVWDMGIVLAAQQLHLDLEHANIDLAHGYIHLHGPNGMERNIPVDAEGNFYINWRITPTHLLREPFENVLREDRDRNRGTNDSKNEFHGKLVVIGSAATGNDLTDRGATPLENQTLLVSKHWNVANSVITGEFIHRTSLATDIIIIIILSILTALFTWQFRALPATLSVLLLITAYFGVVFYAFIQFYWWLPLVYPIAGAMIFKHLALVVYRVTFEEGEKRRVKSVFSKLVSPNVVNELLDAKKLALGGSHREITVFFADVRGFTALTDQMQEQIAEFVRANQVAPAQAEKYFENSARETLEIVNLYLATVAEAVKKHDGTLDKYIGDCVMAFWNAPSTNEKHALSCLRAAIEAQRAIRELNIKRLAENPARELENRERIAAGLPPKPMHAALHLGTGINTGLVTVGLMGSDAHGFNYTVFGREVNLASRLEGVSGSGRIIISDVTYFHLLRHAPDIAETCKELFPEKVKGFRDAVRIYEVPWQNK
ncbi:MAG TPA: adenylate/guanylate cyclase domain-containing protein [Verrucomicrobiae bacterium]